MGAAVAERCHRARQRHRRLRHGVDLRCPVRCVALAEQKYLQTLAKVPLVWQAEMLVEFLEDEDRILSSQWRALVRLSAPRTAHPAHHFPRAQHSHSAVTVCAAICGHCRRTTTCIRCCPWCGASVRSAATDTVRRRLRRRWHGTFTRRRHTCVGPVLSCGRWVPPGHAA